MSAMPDPSPVVAEILAGRPTLKDAGGYGLAVAMAAYANRLEALVRRLDAGIEALHCRAPMAIWPDRMAKHCGMGGCEPCDLRRALSTDTPEEAPQ